MSVKEQNNSHDNIKEHPVLWNLLADHHEIEIDPELIIKLTKETEIVSKEDKGSWKVLHLTSEWNFEELLALFNGLNPTEHPNLFVVIIDGRNFEFLGENLEKSEKIKESVQKFGAGCPLVLQMTSKDESLSKVYYRESDSSQFLEIGLYGENLIEIKDFPSLLRSFMGDKIRNLEQLTAAWQYIIKSPISMKFLKLFENLFFKLILEVTKSGIKADLLTVLDAPAEHEGRVLSAESQNYLSEVLHEKRPKSESVKQKQIENVMSYDDVTAMAENFSSQTSSSVLLSAINHKNAEVIDFLITYWSHLIQEFPFDHQVKVSSAAFESNQLDVLCDLLEIADFPFPEDYEFDDEQEQKRLRRITLDRMAFTTAIKKENFVKIDRFIDNNRNLKYVFSTDNDTTLKQAIELKKFGVFYYLKSLGFQGEDCEDILNQLDKEDRKKATQQAVKQRKLNVKTALVNVHKSVMLLATRSLIHNRRISKKKEAEYRQKIINWLQDIHKVAQEMINVAASCEHLKIVFDFESHTVDSIELETPGSLGLTRRISRWIFIGAKLSDKKREQQIKAVLAHELCHYVMCLVYNNNFLPYFKDAEDIRDKCEVIVKIIDKWSAVDSERPDDECNGNISTVFTCYDSKKFHLELIVRPVQNQVEFDDNENHSAYLEGKYEFLYDFWKEHVLPDLQNFCKRNPKVIKLNKIVELLPRILRKELSTKCEKDIEKVINNKLAVVTTNVPTLLFLDIVEELKKKCRCLLDSQNFFTEPQRLNNVEVWNDFEEICKDVEQLNIFVDCTKEVPGYLEGIFVNKELNFVFVVSNDAQCNKLVDIFGKKKIKDATKIEVKYNWNDLTEESKKLLLEVKIEFQNISEIALKKFFEAKPYSLSKILNPNTINLSDIYEVADDEFLNLIIDGKKLIINSIEELDQNKKYFEILNIKREYTIKQKDTNHYFQHTISQNSFLFEIRNHLYVLISDMAGNGKSWAMKNFTNILREQNPTNWVTYVDLKQFIKKFKAQEDHEIMPEFSLFMAENILKTDHKFESKMFQKLYKDGKVFILFDGFDEIAPNCAEFVSNLAQSFQSNEGNQLWIATRDYFEVDLRNKLKIDVAYGLEEMNDDKGIELIARNWMLMDLRDKKEDMTVEEFNQHVESSSEFKEYRKKAWQIVEKVKVGWRRSVGMPQMFKMIAGAFKDEQDIKELTKSKIYEKFIKILYRRWSREKGEIREEASIESQNLKFKFWEFHQYEAILSKFTALAKILFPGYKGRVNSQFTKVGYSYFKVGSKKTQI